MVRLKISMKLESRSKQHVGGPHEEPDIFFKQVWSTKSYGCLLSHPVEPRVIYPNIRRQESCLTSERFAQYSKIHHERKPRRHEIRSPANKRPVAEIFDAGHIQNIFFQKIRVTSDDTKVAW